MGSSEYYRNLALMIFIKKYWFQLTLSLIIALAALLRFPFLELYPPAMIQDEVGIGYAAISISKTGMDEWGDSFPLVFKSFGDYKAPAFIYSTALLYKIIGFHPVLPRITSAISGLLFVFSITMLTRSLTKSKKLALLAGLLAATNPWTIHLSRMALESNLGLAFFTTGLWLFMKYLNSSKKLSLVLSAGFLSLSTYSFHSYRYSVVLLLIGYLFVFAVFNLSKIRKVFPTIKKIILLLIISTLFSLPGFLTKGATNRLDQTLLFTSDKVVKLYEHYENNCHSTAIELNAKATLLCRIQYNKLSRMALIGTDSLVKHLDPSVYFFSGDSEPVRNPTQTGLFYVFLFPLWMFGVIEVFKKFSKYQFIFVGYLVALLPSLVSGEPHATRLSIFIPFLILTIILGYKRFEKLVTKRGAFIFVLILTIIFTPLHMVKYASDTFAGHEINATFLSYARKTAVLQHEYIQQGYTVYADHDLYPEPHVYYAYYNQIDPRLTQSSLAAVYSESAGFTRPKQFGEKLFFEEGNSNAYDCTTKDTNPTVYMTNDKKEFINPTKIIKDNTNLYEFIYIYTSEDLCKEKIL